MSFIKKIKQSTQELTKQAENWFKKSVKTLATKIPDSMVDARVSSYPPIGEIALFKYDPKHKDTLPYYDTHPLILVVKIQGANDFFGINLHYIPPDIRKKIMNELVKRRDKYEGQPRQYIKSVLPLLEALGNSEMFSHTYKHYKTNHVRSKIAIVKPEYWKIVARMPLQNFEKASDSTVWRDAKKLKSKKARKWGF